MTSLREALDRRMMRLALRAAARGRPSPNPHVGAVVASADEVLAVGHHARAGHAHAEVAALRAAGTLAQGATLYVTMEPCNHHGRTPPCTDAILAAGIARVVVGCADPRPHVPGSLAKLRAAGVEVEAFVLEPQARRIIADFAHHIATGRPFVTLKAAVSLDGRLAASTGDSKWITGERARRFAHRLRAQSDAVLVGIGTVLADDPELTVRHVVGKNPIRAVLDSSLRTPVGARLLATVREAPVVIFHAHDAPRERRDALIAAGATLVSVSRHGDGLSLDEVLTALGKRDVVRLLVEGGGKVHAALLDAGLAHRAAIFVAPRFLGANGLPLLDAPGAAQVRDAWRLTAVRVRRLGDDVLVQGDVQSGD